MTNNTVTNSTTPLIQLKDVTKKFSGKGPEVEALGHISLEIMQGEFVVLVGPSGCGKSTILGLVAGFERPSQGQVIFNGKEVNGPGSGVLMMFQDHALFPWLSVIDNVAFGIRNKERVSVNKARQMAKSYLSLVHLEGFERSFIHELSGGMRHRVALARCLAMDPDLLLIDEPFPSLDVLTRYHLYAEIQEIFSSIHKTMVLVTHDPMEAACLGDRVIVMTDRPGKIASEIVINLPRPRVVTDEGVVRHARTITESLKNGMRERAA